MIQFFTDEHNKYHFYNTDLNIMNNQTWYKSFDDVYPSSLLTEEPHIDLLFTPPSRHSVDDYITNKVLFFECSYEDLPNLPQTHPELFI